MKEITPEKFWELYDQLSRELQDAIFAPQTAEKIKNILQKYELTNKQDRKIPELVGNILLGVTSPKNLESELQTLEMKAEKAKSISQDIHEDIIKSVRIALKGAQQQRERQKRVASTPEGKKEEGSETQDKYREPLQ